MKKTIGIQNFTFIIIMIISGALTAIIGYFGAPDGITTIEDISFLSFSIKKLTLSSWAWNYLFILSAISLLYYKLFYKKSPELDSNAVPIKAIPNEDEYFSKLAGCILESKNKVVLVFRRLETDGPEEVGNAILKRLAKASPNFQMIIITGRDENYLTEGIRLVKNNRENLCVHYSEKLNGAYLSFAVADDKYFVWGLSKDADGRSNEWHSAESAEFSEILLQNAKTYLTSEKAQTIYNFLQEVLNNNKYFDRSEEIVQERFKVSFEELKAMLEIDVNNCECIDKL